MMKLLKLSLLTVLVLGGSAFAQVPPHAVVCVPVVYSDGSTPVLSTDCSFDAYLNTNPANIITETTVGCAVWDDAAGAGLLLECSAFPQGWNAGDVMTLTVTGTGSNYSQAETETFSITLTSDNPQYATGNGPQGEFVLPVEFSSFSAEPGAGAVILRWETTSESDNAGFNILRATEREGAYTKINSELIPGAGNSTETHSYTYADENLTGGLYFYKVEAVSTGGTSQVFGPIEVHPTPTVFALASGYPNPMTQSTEIAFQLPKESIVSVRVYNMAGREVRVLQEGTLQAGYYSKAWTGTDADGRTVGNGVYFVRMDAQGFNATKKLVVLR